jgi:predicted TIM-barrel fold metal-dependent hydrolase
MSTANQALPFKVFDADNHIYEPEDAFLRHLPDRFKRDFYFAEVNGRKKIVIGGMLSEWIPNPTFEVIAAPGSHEAWFRANNPKGLSLRELQGKSIRQPPEWRTAEGRLDQLDQHGLHAALVFPTLASVIEERIGTSPAAGALISSLNKWIDEEWGFTRDERLFSVPFINLTDVEGAVRELEFVLERGARAVAIRPAPVPHVAGSRSFGYPEYDPFWARVAEAGIFVCLHCSDSGYDRITQWWTGPATEAVAFKRNSFQAVMDITGRAIADSLAALICHGTFDRHPNLRVVSVENGASWLAGLMHKLGRAYGQMPQEFKEDPRDTFRKHIFVVPFFEDTPTKLLELIPVERILFGSDWPHAEGLAEPLDYLTEWRGFKEDEVEKVFSGNLKGLLEGKRN